MLWQQSVFQPVGYAADIGRRHSSLYLKALPEVDQVDGGGERHGSLGAGVLEQRREQLPERRDVRGLLLDMQESTGYRTHAFIVCQDIAWATFINYIPSSNHGWVKVLNIYKKKN